GYRMSISDVGRHAEAMEKYLTDAPNSILLSLAIMETENMIEVVRARRQDLLNYFANLNEEPDIFREPLSNYADRNARPEYWDIRPRFIERRFSAGRFENSCIRSAA